MRLIHYNIQSRKENEEDMWITKWVTSSCSKML